MLSSLNWRILRHSSLLVFSRSSSFLNFFSFYRASVSYLCTARYCFNSTACLSVQCQYCLSVLSVRPRQYCLSVRPMSVLPICPSNTSIMSKRMHAFTFYDVRVGYHSSSFSASPPLQNSKGNSISGGVKYMRWEKSTIFDRNCHLSWKRYNNSPLLLWITNRKSYVADQSPSVSTTLSDPEMQDVKGQFFTRTSVITRVPFDLGWHEVEGHVSKGSATPLS